MVGKTAIVTSSTRDILRVVTDAASPNHHAGGNGGNLRSHTDECWECHAPDTPILMDSELSECFISVPHLSPKSCLGDSVWTPILSDCSDMEADMPPWTTKATVLTDKNATHPLIHAHRKRWDSLSGIDSCFDNDQIVVNKVVGVVV